MTDTPDHDTHTSPGPQVDAAERKAGLGVRAVARLIDFVLLAIVNAVVLVVLGDALGTALGAAITLAYFAVLESTSGQTLGKMLMKLRTVGPIGGTPSLDQAVRRNIWVALGVVGVVPLVGGLISGAAQLAAAIMIAVGIADSSGGGRGWHDRFAGGTLVVRTRPGDR